MRALHRLSWKSCLLLVVCVGCASPDLQPTGVFTATETAYQRRLAEVSCAGWFRCPPPSGRPRSVLPFPGLAHPGVPFASEAACVTELTSLRELDAGEFVRVTSSGGGFDAAAFERCMQERLALACTGTRVWSADCDTYLQGTRTLGQTCVFSSECVDGWCDGSCETHVCVPRRTEGSLCNRDEQCARGLVCSRATGTCARQERFAGPDEPCDADLACAAGHFCSTLDGSGTCVPLPGEGEDCASGIQCAILETPGGCRQDGACGPGLVCGGGEDVPEDEAGWPVCRRAIPRAEGETCYPWLLVECDRSQRLRCDTRARSETSSTCIVVHPAGSTPVPGQGACDPDQGNDTCCWDDSYWKDGACRPRKRLGDRCLASHECFSRECWAAPGETVTRCTRYPACIDANNKSGPTAP